MNTPMERESLYNRMARLEKVINNHVLTELTKLRVNQTWLIRAVVALVGAIVAAAIAVIMAK